MDHNTKWQARVIEAINRIGENYRNQSRDVNVSAISPHDRFYEEYAETFRRKLISHLQYSQMYSRSERVKVPYEATFEWIFSPVKTGPISRLSSRVIKTCTGSQVNQVPESPL
jgi:hypothetical protein